MGSQLKNVQPIRSKREIQEFKEVLLQFGSKRDYFLFLLGINTGLRISDMVDLKVGDVKGENKFILKEKKRGNIRTIRLVEIKNEIDEYTKFLKDNDYLFPSKKGGHISTTQAYRILEKAAELLGRKDIGTHTMRKTFGYWHYKKNKDIAVLMETFGHSSPEITKRYIGLTDEEIDESLKGFKL